MYLFKMCVLLVFQTCTMVVQTFTLYSRSVWFLTLKLLSIYLGMEMLDFKGNCSHPDYSDPLLKRDRNQDNIWNLGSALAKWKERAKEKQWVSGEVGSMVQWFTTKPSKSLSVVAFSILSTKWRFSSVSCSKNDIANIVLKLKQLKFQGLQLERTQWVS